MVVCEALIRVLGIGGLYKLALGVWHLAMDEGRVPGFSGQVGACRGGRFAAVFIYPSCSRYFKFHALLLFVDQKPIVSISASVLNAEDHGF
jgi:pentatricopeptide repeat protein